MIKLSIVILLLLEVEPFVCSRELNLNEIFLALIVPYFDLYLSVMFEFCTISTYLKIRKEQKNIFQGLRQRTPMEHFNLRVQGLSLASDGAYDKHDA